MADVVRDSVSLAAWIDDELRQGHKILVNRGEIVAEILFPHANRLQVKRPEEGGGK